MTSATRATVTAPGGGTQTVERPDTLPQTGGGGKDPSHRAHIIKRPKDQQSAEAYVLEARVMGFEIEALCGHRWVPSRDPERHPVCEACRDILASAP